LKEHQKVVDDEITFIKTSSGRKSYSQYPHRILNKPIDFSMMKAMEQSLTTHQESNKSIDEVVSTTTNGHNPVEPESIIAESTSATEPTITPPSQQEAKTPSKTKKNQQQSMLDFLQKPSEEPVKVVTQTPITPTETTIPETGSKQVDLPPSSPVSQQITKETSPVTVEATMETIEEESEEDEEDDEYEPSRKKLKQTEVEELDEEESEEKILRQKQLEEQRKEEEELLSRESQILEEIKEMQRKGEWIPQTQQKIGKEPKRGRSHWDYLLAEMQYISNDVAKERKWKMTTAKKNAKSCAKFHQQIIQEEIKKQKEIELNLRKHASKIAKLVKKEFWDKINKLVRYKNQSKIDETKQQLLDEKRDLLVEQTEKFTKLISQDMMSVTSESSARTDDISVLSTVSNEKEEEVAEDFSPSDSEDDMDHVIESEDEDEDYEDEIEQLKREMEMDIGDIMKSNYNHADESEPVPSTEVIPSNEKPVETNIPAESEVMTDDTEEPKKEAKFLEVSANAQQYQPTGFTLKTTQVKTPIPFLLSENLRLREYQQIGLDWLVTMHDKGLNGILADEMGLGKTIMTISMIAHLACKEKIWGPHLVVVPSSVLLNWEIEFKRWCPSLKILSYHGSQKQRKEKRVGWNKPNTFHVCITSYNLIIQDKVIFKRKKWHYLILDEAHHIRNFKGQAWQTLLNFNTEHRLLLTGTPLQNNVMELWSLMHFLMPHIFQSHSEFKDWFSNSIQGMVEGKQEMNKGLIERLHTILRPFILRRLKKEVSEQLPSKQEHVVRVRLSKRQRFLYEDFISRSDTRDTLASGNVFKMINVVMQLRKVCNHPDLFEPRPIFSPFTAEPIELMSAPISAIEIDSKYSGSDEYFTGIGNSLRLKSVLFSLKNFFNFVFTNNELSMSKINFEQVQDLRVKPNEPNRDKSLLDLEHLSREDEQMLYSMYSDLNVDDYGDNPAFKKYAIQLAYSRYMEKVDRLHYMQVVNSNRYDKSPVYGFNLINKLQSITFNKNNISTLHGMDVSDENYSHVLNDMCKSMERIAEDCSFELDNFVCFIPSARTDSPYIREVATRRLKREHVDSIAHHIISPTFDLLRKPMIRMQMNFPDKRLLQFDCGKLQKMASMLKELKREGHRVLIFTQMSKMLDVLESFMSMHGHSYFRLDGQTKLEQRQYMMERFNNDPKIFAFILSTRSGGVGINLTGADTVIFYDSDWNPAMDAQAQDRCHRIGQTRNVNIYRLISESTIEERILLKANQKRHMNDIVIHNGAFTPDFLKNQIEVRDLFQDSLTSGGFSKALRNVDEQMQQYNAIMDKQKEEAPINEKDVDRILASVEDESDVEALKNAKKEQDEQDHQEFGDAECNEEDDIINHLTPIEKFAFEFLAEQTMNSVHQEIEDMKQLEKERTENWKNEIKVTEDEVSEPEDEDIKMDSNDDMDDLEEEEEKQTKLKVPHRQSQSHKNTDTTQPTTRPKKSSRKKPQTPPENNSGDEGDNNAPRRSSRKRKASNK